MNIATVSMRNAGGPHPAAKRHDLARLLFGGLTAYAAFFALAPDLAWAFPFEAMFYGDTPPPELATPGAARPFAFTLSLLGAIMMGWLATLTALVGHLTVPAWRAVGIGVFVWFVADGAVSLMHGFWQNVLTNLAFAALLALAWWQARPASDEA